MGWAAVKEKTLLLVNVGPCMAKGMVVFPTTAVLDEAKWTHHSSALWEVHASFPTKPDSSSPPPPRLPTSLPSGSHVPKKSELLLSTH